MTGTAGPPPALRRALDTEVRDVMRPGVVTIGEDAPLTDVLRAIAAHGVHAILVLGHETGAPLGWVTARGLLAWLGSDAAHHVARDAITERAVTIAGFRTAREAARVLVAEEVSHLLVAPGPDHRPDGVVAELDLVRLVTR
ncbi:MAG TPA: CBS domain-containing protein [Solirubrobacteraceae bacterium]|nr:CBS domain-containing protein [Solirubrobacteraceae bacterium]